jgi:hypothetical protein
VLVRGSVSYSSLLVSFSAWLLLVYEFVAESLLPKATLDTPRATHLV